MSDSDLKSKRNGKLIQSLLNPHPLPNVADSYKHIKSIEELQDKERLVQDTAY